MRAVVVGAGAIGSCVALDLAEQGVQVVLVDGQDLGTGLSAHGFGWVNAVDNGSAPYYALTLEAQRAHDRLAARTEGAPWLFRRGNLHWAHTAREARGLRAVADGYRALDYPVEEVDAADVRRELEPGLALDGVHGPLFHYPADAYVISDRFLAAVQEKCRGAGVVIRPRDPVTGFPGGDPARGVTLASGARVAADTVVICAGRGTAGLLRQVGAFLPLVEPGDARALTLGLLVRTSTVPVHVERILHAPELSVRPHTDGRLVLHCHDVDEELVPGTPDELAAQGRRAARRVLGRLAEVLPGVGREVGAESAYVGVRPLPADGMSVLGRVPEAPSLYVVVTHSGLTLAPVLGEIVAQEVRGEPSPLAAAFRPERFTTAGHH